MFGQEIISGRCQLVHLIIFIVVSTLLAFLLIQFGGPMIGGIIALGIILGCLFRGIDLLNEINEKLSKQMEKSNDDDDHNEG